jgi:hypothetical protein
MEHAVPWQLVGTSSYVQSIMDESCRLPARLQSQAATGTPLRLLRLLQR